MGKMSEDHAGHHHDHASGHSHSHAVPSNTRAFAIGVGLNLAFVIAEAIYGLSANSLALLADAGHNLSDVFGLLLAWGASRLARVAPTPRRTYGWRRASILAALANAVVLLVAVGGIAWEAVQRFRHPEPVAGLTVIWVAAAGVLVNGASALLFAAGREHDINIRGAFLHLAADAVVSLGVVIAGLVILRTGWQWLDPAVSLVVAVVITVGTWDLLRESVNLSMDAVPPGIDPTAVGQYLAAQPGVQSLHDLHIWAMSTTENALTAHLVMQPPPADDRFLRDLEHELHERFGIEHTTIQVEHGADGIECRQAPAEAI